MAFFLREDLSFCRSAGRVILLDMREGRYFALPARCVDAFSRWADGFEPVTEDAQILAELARLNVLIPAEKEGLPVQATAAFILPSKIQSIVPKSHPSLMLVIYAIAMRLLWSWRVRHWPLAKSIGNVRNLVSLRTQYEVADESERLSRIVQAFRYADFVVGNHDRCLPRSLALIAACRKRGLSCKLVIGVQAVPFIAHCWVQNAATVLNETPDRAQTFTPILVS